MNAPPTKERNIKMLDTIKCMFNKGEAPHIPSEEEIRERAYHLWEEAGRPEGDGVDFWVKAEAELAPST